MLKFILFIIFIALPLGIYIWLLMSENKKKPESKQAYGYENNKVIDSDKISYYRDIPCNKDIFYALSLMKLNKIDSKKINVIGAIILKWIKEGKIILQKENNDIIYLNKDNDFYSEKEKMIFSSIYRISDNGKLKIKKIKNWYLKRRKWILETVDGIIKDVYKKLYNENHIRYSMYKKENETCGFYYLDDQMYNDSINLIGLKKYLEDFSNMDSKETLDVSLWDEYLIFANLFGIAEEVSKKINNVCPEVIKKSYGAKFIDFLLMVIGFPQFYILYIKGIIIVGIILYIILGCICGIISLF